MTEEEYKTTREEIIKKFGNPEWDLNKPMNKAAEELQALKLKKATDARSEKAAERRVARGERPGALAAAGGVEPTLPESDLTPDDLLGFDDQEKQIAIQYFKNIRQSPKEIETALGIPYQRVTNVLNSQIFILLKARVFKRAMTHLSYITVINGLIKGDTKLARDVLTDSGDLKNSENANSAMPKAIDDKESSEVLKRIGDSIAQGLTLDIKAVNTSGSSSDGGV